MTRECQSPVGGPHWAIALIGLPWSVHGSGPDVVTAAEVAGQELVAPNLVRSGDDGYIGPFTANPVDTTAGARGIDVVMPRGLY